jgi:hypothetical protein
MWFKAAVGAKEMAIATQAIPNVCIHRVLINGRAGRAAARKGSHNGKLDALTAVISPAARHPSQRSVMPPRRVARRAKCRAVNISTVPNISFPTLPAVTT